jgi:putative DNA modification/repair radical SAM protein
MRALLSLLDFARRREQIENMLSTLQKLEILADAAKYDASCASSGAEKRDSKNGGIGSTSNGICHSYTPDGRCVSLLKILLTNACVFDCAYCINRRSSNLKRARFSVKEVVALTLNFYKRNYIEGLFLSSGIIKSSDYTMELMVRVARSLREEHGFKGYIHLKSIPDADPALIAEAGRLADRLSINVELPTEAGLKTFAPEKRTTSIKTTMANLKVRIAESQADPRAPKFSPAGQGTQMIVGADGANDATIVRNASTLYASYDLKRIYYSAFSPIPDSSRLLPLQAAPLQREHRLYQADWLYRFYGFSADEIATSMTGGMLDLEIDPKLAWALQNRARFPLNVNTAAREELLRIPGFGSRTVDRIIVTRKHRLLRIGDIARLAGSLRRARPFFIAQDWRPVADHTSANLRAALVPPPKQLSLFA